MTTHRCPRCGYTLMIRWASGTPHCPRCGPPWQPLEPDEAGECDVWTYACELGGLCGNPLPCPDHPATPEATR